MEGRLKEVLKEVEKEKDGKEGQKKEWWDGE